MQWINYRVRVSIQDSRTLVGTLIAFDRHLNLVLTDTEEYRRLKPKRSKGGPNNEENKGQDTQEAEKEVKRALGLVLLRGENIVTLSAEAPPSVHAKKVGQGIPPA